jgi:hypothetical protein
VDGKRGVLPLTVGADDISDGFRRANRRRDIRERVALGHVNSKGMDGGVIGRRPSEGVVQGRVVSCWVNKDQYMSDAKHSSSDKNVITSRMLSGTLLVKASSEHFTR